MPHVEYSNSEKGIFVSSKWTSSEIFKTSGHTAAHKNQDPVSPKRLVQMIVKMCSLTIDKDFI